MPQRIKLFQMETSRFADTAFAFASIAVAGAAVMSARLSGAVRRDQAGHTAVHNGLYEFRSSGRVNFSHQFIALWYARFNDGASPSNRWIFSVGQVAGR